LDIFFMLSGYILAANYLHYIGERFDIRATGRFVWARVARIWPTYIFAIHLCAVITIISYFLFNTGGLGKMTGGSYIRQLLLIQEWGWTGDRVKTWAGPGWSLSAEWLAYLLFPLLALIVLRVGIVARTRTLIAMGFMALVPLMVVNVAQGGFGGAGGGWTIRIITDFVAGMLLFAAVSKLKPTQFQRHLAGIGTIVTIGVIIAIMYIGDNLWQRSFILPLFIPMLGFMAIGTGPIERLLSTRVMVLGGGISFALYLIHTTTLRFYRDMADYLGWADAQPLWSLAGEAATIPLWIGVAYLMFRYIEEPARRSMRSMIDMKIDPVTDRRASKNQATSPPSQSARHAGAPQPDGESKSNGSKSDGARRKEGAATS
ncbi:MAG TPA: acyltransferase, partial [Nocardioidaceae bacterium]|nr:acyltransferase [Nocardioidaceae bacterium]